MSHDAGSLTPMYYIGFCGLIPSGCVILHDLSYTITVSRIIGVVVQNIWNKAITKAKVDNYVQVWKLKGTLPRSKRCNFKWAETKGNTQTKSSECQVRFSWKLYCSLRKPIAYLTQMGWMNNSAAFISA